MICAGRNWVATMILRALPILLLALPLAGCYGVTASKEIPAWAMSSGAESDATQRRAVRRASAPRPPAEDTDVAAERLIPSDVTTINTGNASLSSGGRQLVVRSQPQRTGPEKPAATRSETRDVWASDPADDELRRRMTICRGC
jgi:hypothetical protein